MAQVNTTDKMGSTEFVIMDPWLASVAGHYYEYDKSIIEELKRRNIPVKVFASENINKPVRESLDAVPFFKYLTKNITSLSPRKLKLTVGEYKNFFNQTSSQSIVFAPNISSGKQLLVLGISMLFISKRKYKKLVLLCRYIPDNPAQIFFYKLGARLLKNKVEKNKIVYTADSELVANDCYKLSPQKVHVLPIPHVYVPTNKIIEKRNHLVKLFLPGEVRIDKGIFTILKAVDLLVSQNKFDIFELTVQYNPDSHYDRNKEIGQLINELSKKANVRMLSSLTSEDYSIEFQQADIILAPYISKSADGHQGYQSRTSGVFSEAVAAGKPVITTKDTWMSYQLEKLGSGICITRNSYTELAEALLKISGSIEEYNELAKKAIIEWTSFHNTTVFCDKLIAISS